MLRGRVSMYVFTGMLQRGIRCSSAGGGAAAFRGFVCLENAPKVFCGLWESYCYLSTRDGIAALTDEFDSFGLIQRESVGMNI